MCLHSIKGGKSAKLQTISLYWRCLIVIFQGKSKKIRVCHCKTFIVISWNVLFLYFIWIKIQCFYFYGFCVAATAASHLTIVFLFFLQCTLLCKRTLILQRDIQNCHNWVLTQNRIREQLKPCLPSYLSNFKHSKVRKKKKLFFSVKSSRIHYTVQEDAYPTEKSLNLPLVSFDLKQIIDNNWNHICHKINPT